ncbi:MAG: cytochrome c maturation protein CcmE [Candidatus Kapaibacteriales bacterium]
MNKGLIIAIVGAVGFAVLAFTMFDTSKIEFKDFASADNGNTVKVMGTWNKDVPYEHDLESNTFTFELTDQTNVTRRVVHSGSKPNNFELADMIVVQGTMGDNGTFNAEHILTKCPSKYEGTGKDFKEKNIDQTALLKERD